MKEWKFIPGKKQKISTNQTSNLKLDTQILINNLLNNSSYIQDIFMPLSLGGIMFSGCQCARALGRDSRKGDSSLMSGRMFVGPVWNYHYNQQMNWLDSGLFDPNRIKVKVRSNV